MPTFSASRQLMRSYDSGVYNKAAMLKSFQITNNQIWIDHQLNLIVSKAVESKKAPTIAQALESFKVLLTHVNHSLLALETILHRCKEMVVLHVKPIAPVATRWKSSTLMVKSIHRLRVALEAFKEVGPTSSLDYRISTSDVLQSLLHLEEIHLFNHFVKFF